METEKKEDPLARLGALVEALSEMAKPHGYAVTARRADSPTSRLLWRGSGATPQDAREDMLRTAHSGWGMPLAFSEAEAKMRIALAGEDAFRPACRDIETFAGPFEEEAQ